MAEKMSRSAFIKKTGLAAVAVLLASNGNLMTAQAANVTDNLAGGGGGFHIDTQPPANKRKGWISTNATYGQGVLYFYGEKIGVNAWVPITSTWNI